MSTVLNEGKTKIIRDNGDGTVLVESKDDITAGDGARHDVMEGKAALATETTCNVFELLNQRGIPTHYIGRVGERTFLARNVNMLPLELVARRVATGSYLDRTPSVANGTVFDDLVFEVFDKDDPNHDPLLAFDFEGRRVQRYVANTKAAKAIGDDVKAGDLLDEVPLDDARFNAVTPELLAELEALTLMVFATLEEAWAQHGGVLFDFKIEVGFDTETGELLVADVIDNDSWRLRVGDEQVDKQSYRDGTKSLPTIKLDYTRVAELSREFVN